MNWILSKIFNEIVIEKFKSDGIRGAFEAAAIVRENRNKAIDSTINSYKESTAQEIKEKLLAFVKRIMC